MIPKEIMKLYEKLAFSRGYEEAFRDFLDVCLYYLSVGMLAEDYRRVEKRYKPYEMELFVQMFYRVSEYSEGFCDVLGDMFMECVSHGNNGQFFTPIHVADLMDGGIDHVLIDEAQDTSPNQWAIVKAVTDRKSTRLNSSHSV